MNCCDSSSILKQGLPTSAFIANHRTCGNGYRCWQNVWTG